MKLAYVHVLPLEYYPPATNALAHFSRQAGWEVRAWSSRNMRGVERWSHPAVVVSRPDQARPNAAIPRRAAGYAAWHVRTATELSRWKPDVILAVEPHSTLAVWLYYSVFRGTAPLFIHNHEYYSEDDYRAPGMRLLRMTRRLDRDTLLGRAVWVSETNPKRLEMLERAHPEIRSGAGRVLPNYPPEEWIARGSTTVAHRDGQPTRFIYVGSASFEDAFIREAVEWAAAHPEAVSLHVTGDNVASNVWDWIESLAAANVTVERRGVQYDRLPELLAQFDVGLVLYKGNTLNFVHNVPNKAMEYLACGLEVWYPSEMQGMRDFRALHPELRLVERDFRRLPSQVQRVDRQRAAGFPFTCESALAPLIAAIEEAVEERR
jgi:hypothetical protein